MGSSSTELCAMKVEWGQLALDGELEHKKGPQQTRVWLHVNEPDGSPSSCVALRLEHLKELQRELQAAIEWVAKEEEDARKREAGLSNDG